MSPRPELVFQQAGPNIWTISREFSLGKGEHEHLTDKAITARLSCLYNATSFVDCVGPTDLPESTREELKEECFQMENFRVAKEKNKPFHFPLQTRMTVIFDPSSGEIYLHSVVDLDDDVEMAWDKLIVELKEKSSNGHVTLAGIICPNLQHWTFVVSWLKKFPDLIKIYVVPSYGNEDLQNKIIERIQEQNISLKEVEKLKHRLRFIELQKGNFPPNTSEKCLNSTIAKNGIKSKVLLQAAPLEGAGIGLNEYMFYHHLSNTLLLCDSFYGGFHSSTSYSLSNNPCIGPTWFERVWFKYNKQGSFQKAALPQYRTAPERIHCASSVLNSAEAFVENKDIKQIIYAHGNKCPYTKHDLENEQLHKDMALDFPIQRPTNLNELFVHCWKVGLDCQKSSGIAKNLPNMVFTVEGS